MLTDQAVKAAKPTEKPYKLSDGKGLVCIVQPNGARLWRLRFYLKGKERMLALGQYPEVSLRRAREKALEARTLVADGRDPVAAKRAERSAAVDTFEAVGLEWHNKQRAAWSRDHAATVLKRLKAGLFPWLGDKHIASIEAPALLAALRRTESRGHVETAHRLQQYASHIFAYAVATGTGGVTRNPAKDIEGALAPYKWKPRAALLIPSRVGELLRAIDTYQGQPATMSALKLAPLVFLRPGELRLAEWAEFDLEARDPVWRLPAERMKMDRDHLVPLAKQAVHILRELHPLTGSGRLVFPAVTHTDRPLSENTLNAALARMGYGSDVMTAHGFRAMAATLLSELGYAPDVIERQLAHQEANKVKAAYQRSEHLTERRKMMQAWADYLDGLKASTNVVAIGSRA